jgi:hypothetical protein
MELNKNQLSIILDGLRDFDTDDDYISYDGNYKLTKSEIDELISMIAEELK